MKIYGLTGGIGAGKSEAARRFQELGIPVIDADQIGHSAIEAGGVAEQAVIQAFGDRILTCGKIDREKLGAIVFDDSDALKQLNDLVHPAVGAEIAQRYASYAEEGRDAVIVEAALHGEDGKLRPEMAGLILVQCPREERIRRLVEKRGMTEEDAKRRIASQSPPEDKASMAKWIIDNSGGIEEMDRQVDAISKEL